MFGSQDDRLGSTPTSDSTKALEEMIKNLQNQVNFLQERITELENQITNSKYPLRRQNKASKIIKNIQKLEKHVFPYTFASQTALEKQISEKVKKDDSRLANRRKEIYLFRKEVPTSSNQKQSQSQSYFKTLAKIQKMNALRFYYSNRSSTSK